MGAPIGLIAGGGTFPFLFARAAKAQGLTVHAVAHRGEADPALAGEVASITWVRLGQAQAILRALRGAGVEQAVMAGGIGRVKSLTQAWPDAGGWKIALGMRSLRDDELLRAIARYFEEGGVRIVAPTDFVPQVLAGSGLLAGAALTDREARDVQLGHEVATALGRADVGQTVIVKDGVVLAVEAVEGTDEAIRRAGRLGGAGAVVVKRCKPNQDLRFDLPAVGPVTLEVMREAKARVLAIEAGRTVLLDGPELLRLARQLGISVVGA
ncbi:MAG: UDP-2,3-diacylglucosamine diphosphatase LpxI [Archangiaceae bacterium]|nr:UDP-2,3-diacylglucosamine diphosphatase LpxI [Archangiaceae bacterium]